MKETTATYENIMNKTDYLEPSKPLSHLIEIIGMVEISKIPEYYEEIPDCKLIRDRNLI